MFEKKDVLNYLDANQERYFKISDQIWDFAEIKFDEYKSVEVQINELKNEGFTIERDAAGLETALIATYGTGKPIIGLLGEYDALSGLSQKEGQAIQEPLVKGANGHGCGHNLLGTGAMAASIGVKKYLEENKVAGTVRYYGCPAEEGGSGKAFLARAGVFNDLDIAMTWHPFQMTGMFSVSTLANIQAYFRFHGISSHAAASPHLGRSALDAVELMNVGVNYLREHIIQEARVHYAVTNTGGISPNVVQAKAEVLYLIRAPKINQAQDIYNRIIDIAKGAALMTGTKLEVIFDKACSDLIPNKTVEEVIFDNLVEIGLPEYTDEDIEVAEKFHATLTNEDITANMKTINASVDASERKALAKIKDKVICDVIIPYKYNAWQLPGSTDVGDVSWNVPTGQLIAATCAFGTPIHSWQFVAQGKTHMAHNAMLMVSKVLAAACIDFINNPEKITQAKEELIENLEGETYKSPIPENITKGKKA